MALKLGLVMGIGTNTYTVDMDCVKEAENLGFDSIWTSEAWGSDAVTPAAWILAQTSNIKVGTGIIQMPARTPSCVAMTAMTLNALSGGRFILGLGPSGPQVVEGWHGVPYGRPITRLREYVQIIRKILEREGPLTHEGYHYQIPLKGGKATGLGKPLKSILHGDPSLKIFSAAISPSGVKAAAELTDGFIPFFMDPNGFHVFEADINAGLEKAGGEKSLTDFDIAPFCEVSIDNDLKSARQPVRENLAFYIGGMGARDKNFYNDFCKRVGFADAAVEIQDHFLAGRRKKAQEAVPDELIDKVALVGPKERIVDRLQDWKKAAQVSHVDSLLIKGATKSDLLVFAETVL
ncbi:MAG TPA: LLM class F420-dependent oxidoreductase [Rhodospirillales bacterium]|nr:LLM class F420-dependent oxidoreductase [Rhodospirillales bacterium]